MRISGSGWGLVAVSATVVGLLVRDVATLVDDLTSPSFPDASLAAGSLLLIALASWSLLAAAAVVLGASSRVVTAMTPAVLRRALVVGAAGALSIAPAHADQQAVPDAQRHTVGGLALPDRPEVAAAAHRPTRTVATAPSGAVRVRPGDTLWGIAGRSLPDGATDAEVAGATRAWHRANRDVIGDDPDLIVPEQILEPPAAKDLP